jgi:AAA family ATP:ADP antiporter
MATSGLERLLSRTVLVAAGERRALVWSFAYFFFLLAGYYLIRPVRDAMGIAGGVRNLPWLFTATFLVLIAVQPAYGVAVARLSRRYFIPLVYHFFVVNIFIFWLLFIFHIRTVEVARIFFVWVGVFNLFVVSVFWSFMADIFTSEQSRRLFGFIGAGGTAGSLLGPTLAVTLSVPLGAANLLLIAALFLEAAIFCARRLESASRFSPAASTMQLDARGERPAQAALGGSALDGLLRMVRSPYLLGIAAWVSLLSFSATILYFQQAHIVAAAAHSRALQTRIFASIDFIVALLTLATQIFATGPLILRFGMGAATGFLPAVFTLGFVALAGMPGLVTLIAFQAIQRTAHFSIASPARQALFTVVPRQDKYKVKNMIDLVVYRGSDALYGWLFVSLRAMGLSVGAIAALAVPVTVAWLLIAVALGRGQERQGQVLEAASAVGG